MISDPLKTESSLSSGDMCDEDLGTIDAVIDQNRLDGEPMVWCAAEITWRSARLWEVGQLVDFREYTPDQATCGRRVIQSDEVSYRIKILES